MLTNTEFQMFLDRMQQMVSPLEAQIQELTKQVEELSNGKETPKRSASRGKRVQQAQENA
jgi:hypothetical protein